MRDITLLIIVATLCLSGIIMPWYGLMGYVWFSLLRPEILAYSPPNRPYSMALAIATLFGSLRELPRIVHAILNPFIGVFILLQVWYGASVVAAINRQLSVNDYIPFLQLTVMLFLFPLLIHEFRQLKVLVMVFGVALGTLGVRYGLYGLLHGGVRYAQGYGGTMNDNNLLALALACSIPVNWYCRELATWKPAKWFFGLTAGITAMGVVMFYSRGAIVTLGIVLPLMVLRANRKGLALAMLFGTFAGGVVLAGSSLVQRVQTIAHYEDDDSAAGRLEYWKAALKMSADYPLFGVGFGGLNYIEQASRYLPNHNERGHFVHNTYLQVLADSGYPAMLTYCGLFFGSLWWLQKIRKALKENKPDAVPIVDALQLSLLAYCIGSTFVSRVMYDYGYMLVMATGCVWMAYRKEVLPLLHPAPAAPEMPAIEVAVDAPTADPEGAVAPEKPEWQMSGRERRALLRDPHERA